MSDEQSFDAAFAEAMGIPVEAEAAPATEPADAPEPAPASESDPVEAPEPVDTQEPAVVQEPVDTPKPVDAPAPAPAQPYIDPKYLAQAIAEAQQQVAQQQLAQQQATQQPEPPKAATYEDFLSADQKAQLAGFSSEWADVAAPVSVLINAHVQAALANQQRDILAQVQQQMAPVVQVTAQSREAMHWNAIAAAHPDYREVAGKLPAWIEQQPSFLRGHYQRVMAGGSAAEAVELLSLYKQAVGSTGAAPAQPASSAVQAPPKPAPVSKAALAATAAVPPAQRTSVVTAKDPNDAEAAFLDAFTAR